MSPRLSSSATSFVLRNANLASRLYPTQQHPTSYFWPVGLATCGPVLFHFVLFGFIPFRCALFSALFLLRTFSWLVQGYYNYNKATRTFQVFGVALGWGRGPLRLRTLLVFLSFFFFFSAIPLFISTFLESVETKQIFHVAALVYQ